MDLAELRERLEKASAGDREIDGIFASTFEGWTLEKMKGDACPYWRKPDAEWFKRQKDGPPRYTSSLDAIVSLVERKLPGCVWLVRGNADLVRSHKAEADIERLYYEDGPRFRTLASTTHHTAPLALCLAFVKAMEAQSNEPASERVTGGSDRE
jgi:hypothetical protein